MTSFTVKALKLLARISGSKNKMHKQMRQQITQSAAPPKAMYERFDVDHVGAFENGVYRISRKQPTGNKTVVHLHGGAYVFGIMKPYWWFFQDIVSKGADHLYVVDYPLAYNAKAPDVIALATNAVKQAITLHGANNVTLMGDSAGGGLALAVAQVLRSDASPQPKQIITFSPWLDITMSNPNMPALADKDITISIDALKVAGELYRGPLAPHDPLVSPIHADLEGLAPLIIYMTNDEVFAEDAYAFLRYAKLKGQSFDYREWPDLFHAWVVTPVPEAHKARTEVYAML